MVNDPPSGLTDGEWPQETAFCFLFRPADRLCQIIPAIRSKYADGYDSAAALWDLRSSDRSSDTVDVRDPTAVRRRSAADLLYKARQLNRE